MKKRIFKCPTCKTIMAFIIEDNNIIVHDVPPCICGKSRMIDMATDEYADKKF